MEEKKLDEPCGNCGHKLECHGRSSDGADTCFGGSLSCMCVCYVSRSLYASGLDLLVSRRIAARKLGIE